jgi:hypothetical protein
MAGKLSSFALSMTVAIALCGLLATGAQAERVEWSSPVSFETSAGAVSCAASPEAPLWAEVLATATPKKLSAEVLAASPVRCSIPTYGEVEVAAGGFPWRFTASTSKRTGRLKGTKRLIVEVTLLSVGAKCVYEAASVTGSLSGEAPFTLSYSAPKVRLNTKRSFFLCPAVEGFSGSLPLP